ncbi:DMT family transporter [Vibrio sp. ZSDZ34]|uniref:DMT family transporter n=1 Tax=Vibrio gelatinilyticus TaxID=2893468 RepID=A0A9X1WD16_9VIBR|nr:DMT family transporter [Vibrio gelatinilyticus]
MLHNEQKGTLILVATTMLASLGWIFSKETIQGLPPFAFIGLRFVLASLFLLPFCYCSFTKVHQKDIAKSMGVGLLMAMALMCWIYAISISSTLGEGAFILSLSMLFVPIVAWALFKQTPSRTFWMSLPLSIAGLAFLSLADGWLISSSQLWFLASALFLALHFNMNAKLASKMPILLLTCIQLFVTGGFGLTLSLLFETLPDSIEDTIWGWFALSTLVATSLRYVLQTTGQKYVLAANAALIMLLEPIGTVILSVIWYEEQMTMSKLIGCTLIFLSLVIYRAGGRIRRFFH